MQTTSGLRIPFVELPVCVLSWFPVSNPETSADLFPLLLSQV